MNVLLLGILCDKYEEAEQLILCKQNFPSATNTFQWNLINGIEENDYVNLDILNVLPVGTFPSYNKIFLKTKKWSNKGEINNNLEIGTINLPFLKQFMRTVKIKRAVKKWVSLDPNNNKILIYSTYQPFLSAVKNLPKDIHISLIVTDLPEYYDLSSMRSRFFRLLRYINNRIISRLLSRIDSFVLLTDAMKDRLKISEKPYIVVEGLAVSCDIEDNNVVGDERIILYAGSLHYKYGIKTLINAFMLINKANYKLWICGSGEASDEIKSLSRKFENIIFHGQLTKADLIKLQKKATVLINPRPTGGEYTKYSFPSKTMEYLVAGKPVIMYRLAGIPREYDKYICFIEGTGPLVMKNKIEELCHKSNSELKEIGMRAREWILREKSSAVQARKMLSLFEKGVKVV